MSKINLSNPTSGFNLAAINANFDAIEEEFNTKVLYRLNPGSEPNQMGNHLDMNGYDVVNVGSLNGFPASSIGNIADFVERAEVAAESAENSEVAATSAADSANSSALIAAQYSTLGLGGGPATDLGLITDSVIIFPTDYGTIV